MPSFLDNVNIVATNNFTSSALKLMSELRALSENVTEWTSSFGKINYYHVGNWYFSGSEMDSGKGTWEDTKYKKEDAELRLLEAVCVQHEIFHCLGKTIFDCEIKSIPIKSDKRYSRNEVVGITNGKEFKELKWKKALPLIKSGKWEIYIGGSIT